MIVDERDDERVGGRNVGRFYVEFEVANNVDLVLADEGMIEPDEIRRARIRGLVDLGATRLVSAPESVGFWLKDEKVIDASAAW